MDVVPIIFRLSCYGAAFAMGWLLYMLAMVMTVYDGVLSMIFQPIMAAIFSGLAVGVVAVLGLFLRLPYVREFWNGSILPSLSMAILSVAALGLGYPLGFVDTVIDPDTGASITLLHPAVAIGGTLALLFAIANLPRRIPFLEAYAKKEDSRIEPQA